MTNIFDIKNQLESNMSSIISTTNNTIDSRNSSSSTSSEGPSAFADEESVNYLLNQIGLTVQRQGG